MFMLILLYAVQLRDKRLMINYIRSLKKEEKSFHSLKVAFVSFRSLYYFSSNRFILRTKKE